MPGYFLSGLFIIPGSSQGPESGKKAQYILPARISGKVLSGCFQDEIDLFLEWLRFERCPVNQGVGGSKDNFVIPWYGKHNPAITGLGYHNGMLALQEFFIEYQVNALARPDHIPSFRIVHLQNIIGKNARCIDYGFSVDAKFLSGFLIDC